MHIDWATLGHIVVVAAAAALTVVLFVAFAVVGWSAYSGRSLDGLESGRTPAMHRAAGLTTAVLCVLSSGLIVGYGLYLIV